MTDDIQDLIRTLRAFPTEQEGRAADVIESLLRQLAEEKAMGDRVWSAWGNWRADDEFLDEDEKSACAAYRKARGL